MADWNRSKDLCSKCNSQLYRITDSSTGELISRHCKWCGERLPSPEEQERMQEDQRICLDGEVGDEAREIRMLQRLQFHESLSPYRTGRSKWVRSGYRRRLKVKKFILLFAMAAVLTALILLLGGWRWIC